MRIHVLPGSGRLHRVHVKPRVIVERASLTYLQDRDWCPHAEGYQGLYKTARGSWWGEAKIEDGELRFFIHKPPKELFSGPHAQCFRHIGSDWWWIHFSKKPSDANDGVLAIERLLAETLL